MDNPERDAAEAPPQTVVDLSKTPYQEPEEGVFMAYANVFNLDWSLHDIRIRFGELMQVFDQDRPTWPNQYATVLEKAAIRMPWYQAKALCNQLTGIIKNYEEINGELKLPKLPAPPKPL